MTKRSNYNKQIGASLLIAILTVISYFTILHYVGRYVAKQTGTETSNAYQQRVFLDLDADGTPEKIEVYRYNEIISSLLIYKNKELLNQWNFKGEKAYIQKYFAGDF